MRPAGQVLKAGFSLGAVAGDPGGHRGPAHPELGGHVCLRDPVVQVAVDHPETAGRGQGCVSVSHEWVFSGRWVVEELPSCGRGPLVSSQPVPRGKNLMTHNT